MVPRRSSVLTSHRQRGSQWSLLFWSPEPSQRWRERARPKPLGLWLLSSSPSETQNEISIIYEPVNDKLWFSLNNCQEELFFSLSLSLSHKTVLKGEQNVFLCWLGWPENHIRTNSNLSLSRMGSLHRRAWLHARDSRSVGQHLAFWTMAIKSSLRLSFLSLSLSLSLSVLIPQVAAQFWKVTWPSIQDLVAYFKFVFSHRQLSKIANSPGPSAIPARGEPQCWAWG